MAIRLPRLLAAVFLLVGGVMHYNLWSSGYRFIPTIGPLFIANFVGSVALAAAVMVSRRATVALAGIIFATGSLTALVLSRTVGVFGFTEPVWTTEALQILASEIGAIVALGIALTVQIRMRDEDRQRPAMQLAPTGHAAEDPA
jgi:4-amino-4-deoxy-L-arabinose transferase-like glycosyltransferase